MELVKRQNTVKVSSCRVGEKREVKEKSTAKEPEEFRMQQESTIWEILVLKLIK